MLSQYLPPYHATAVERLLSAGGVLLGKTNLDEFGMGNSTECSAFGVTKNPKKDTCVAGGSSGGSAAAVAAAMTGYALGSDTGGSVRQPAAFCGIVGMKPTYGRVSRYGLVAFASSMDQIGPMTRTVEENAVLLGVISGKDTHDMTTAHRPTEDFTAELRQGVKGLKIGLPRELFGDAVAEEVKAAVEGMAKYYEAMGAELIPLSLPLLSQAVAAYYVISSAEASSNLSRFDGVRFGCRAEGCRDQKELFCRSRSEGFGLEVKRRILTGTFVLSSGYYEEYYGRALAFRRRLRAELSRVLERCDALLCPTTTTAAYGIGAQPTDSVSRYADDLCTVVASLSGLPALSLPCGITEQGLPIGAQLIGTAFSEKKLYRIGFSWEQGGGK